MEKITYKVVGLDCHEESAMIENVLKPQAGIGEVVCDVLKGTASIIYDPKQISPSQILALISSTGLQAHLVSTALPKQRGKAFLCFLSGFLIFLGLLIHWKMHGSLSDVFGLGLEEEKLPSVVKGIFLASILAGSWFVLPKAWSSARHLRPDMNLLMVVAICGAIFLNQWFEASTVAFLFSLSLLLEHWSVERARRAIGSLLDLSPKMARVIGKELEEKRVEEVEVGQIILIRPGEKIPLDAIILKGSSSVNQAPITGESLPVFKKEGDTVFAGTLNEEGALQCQVSKISSDTTLARIIHMVEEARAQKAKSEQWVQRFALYYTPVMMGLSLLLATLPPLLWGAEWSLWIYRALVLLVIACPCALVISTPVSIVSALTAAARRGLLIKGGVYLETAGRIEALAFDKTGTITEGRPEVQTILPLNEHSEEELLAIAGALEQSSEHPLARAILKKVNQSGIKLSPAADFSIFKGLGAEGTVEGKRYWIGSHRFMHQKTGETPEVHESALKMEDAGHSVIAIGDFQHVCGLISVADSPRPLAREVLESLRTLGIKKLVMLTGDNEATAKALSEKVGLTEYHAELLPEDKVQAIRKLAENHKVVAMVGDGVNDAPALAASHLGIAMGGMGTDAAFETADIVLMSDDLSHLSKLVHHARRTLKIIKQNITLSLGLKALFLVLAIFGMTSLWMAIAADTGASLIVVINGLRLLHYDRS